MISAERGEREEREEYERHEREEQEKNPTPLHYLTPSRVGRFSDPYARSEKRIRAKWAGVSVMAFVVTR